MVTTLLKVLDHGDLELLPRPRRRHFRRRRQGRKAAMALRATAINRQRSIVHA